MITCGELAASSVRVMVSERSPAASGAKVTEIVHEALAASAAPEQLLGELVKSAELLPPMTSAEICSVALPELVTAMLMAPLVVPCVMVAKVAGFGVALTAGAGGGGATPVPLSCTDCGLPGALSVMFSVAVCVPAADGVKVMLMEQNLLGCKTAGTWQVSVSVNWPAPAPLTAIELTSRASAPLLFT